MDRLHKERPTDPPSVRRAGKTPHTSKNVAGFGSKEGRGGGPKQPKRGRRAKTSSSSRSCGADREKQRPGCSLNKGDKEPTSPPSAMPPPSAGSNVEQEDSATVPGRIKEGSSAFESKNSIAVYQDSNGSETHITFFGPFLTSDCISGEDSDDQPEAPSPEDSISRKSFASRVMGVITRRLTGDGSSLQPSKDVSGE